MPTSGALFMLASSAAKTSLYATSDICINIRNAMPFSPSKLKARIKSCAASPLRSIIDKTSARPTYTAGSAGYKFTA